MSTPDNPHVSVLLEPILRLCAPIEGDWLDGTFGAGGYARGLLAAGAARVIGVDRDPTALAMADAWKGQWADRLLLVEGTFSGLDRHAADALGAERAEGLLDGVVLDLGVSSMQLDQAERGFSFMRDGPLDMRMGAEGESAADLVNEGDEELIADILYHYGEERASRRIARTIVAERAKAPITTTARLAEIVAGCLPRPKPGQSHPATRSFQALRIAVNTEFDELVEGLMAAERILKPGGLLAVVSFHSLEDRIVKRFLQERSGRASGGNRYAPGIDADPARFETLTRKPVGPDDDELAVNPRSRSALLRIARRTDQPAGTVDPAALGAPRLPSRVVRRKGR